ncbi:MAG TPA: DUF58 domain-containing protein [Acidimicrobiales bacterium]|nr:DUF58 domain-containing protein [Acidimicrobiales bacterium]
MSQHRRRPRPERFVGPVVSALFLLVAFAAVAHASGSGWVQAVGAVTTGLALVGMVGPAAFAARLNLACVECPRDASAGEPFTIFVVANQPLRCTPVRPGGDAVVMPAGQRCELTLVSPTRGVLTAVRLRLGTAAPLGLLWWARDRVVALPTSVEVAPAYGQGTVFGSDSGTEDEGRGRPVLSVTGDLRGVRAYRHGDSRRRVHWRATAHTGTLMVRETEEQPDSPVRVIADLSEDATVAERQASDALGAVVDLLASGKRVVLETVEHGGRVSAVVSDRRQAGRRLAHAGTNPYADLMPPSPRRR